MGVADTIRDWSQRRRLIKRYSRLELNGDGFRTIAETTRVDEKLKRLVLDVEGTWGVNGGKPLYKPALLIRREGSSDYDGAVINFDPVGGMYLYEWSEEPYGRTGLFGEEFHDSFPVNRGTIQESSFSNLTPENLRRALLDYIANSAQRKKARERGIQIHLGL